MTLLQRIAAVVLVVFMAGAVFAPVVEAVLGVSHLVPDVGHRFADASWPHLLGTNELGQDLFTRLLYGARTSLVVGVLSAFCACVIGTAVGLAAAIKGGVVDAILMRITDALLALPILPLLLIASALDVGKTTSASGAIVRIVVLLSLLSWMSTARLARAQASHVLGLDHVTGAVVLGASWPRIIRVHVLPLCLPPIIVQTTLEVGGNILAESALSFLGLGVQPPVPSWGNMLMSALDVMKRDPPSALLPGLCIIATVVSIQLLGDKLRDKLSIR